MTSKLTNKQKNKQTVKNEGSLVFQWCSQLMFFAGNCE